MKRKDFLSLGGSMLVTSALHGNPKSVNGITSLSEETEDNYFQGTLENLGGMTLQKLLEYHQNYLMETYIPNWDRGVDWKYGGFADELSPGQEPNFEKKSTYYQARAIWVFSYLYNHISHNRNHLDAAVRGRDFLIKHALTDDYQWISFLNRQGERLSEPVNHYGDIYMILALSELYIATRDDKNINLAKRTAFSVMERLVSSTYQSIDSWGPALEPGTKRLGGWQHFLNSLTNFLRIKPDQGIEQIARYCVRMICEHHWLPEYGVLVELVDNQYKPYTFTAPNWGGTTYLRVVSGWHGIQASWMLMDEAMRVNYYPAFKQGIKMGLSTMRNCYLEGQGMTSIKSPEDPTLSEVVNPWGALDDALVFCLLTLEHTHDPMAIHYYNSCFKLYTSKPENFQPYDLLHIPRRFFLTINILNRIIDNKGKISGFWQE
jgi:mannose/cellobiose epimerase-like protein (N-acyl-D-glucosamine 2-epimerase family)